jgi:glucose/arabinose dehydrogenase
MIPLKSRRLYFAAFVIVAVTVLASGNSTGTASAAQAASVPKNLKFDPIVSGLNDPLFVTHAGDGSNRVFIVQREGQILIYKNGALNTAPFLDISGLVNSTGGEQGLLGLAFDPDYGTNGRFFVVYTVTQNNAVKLARYTVSNSDPDLANPNGTVLLTIDKPAANHNGGMIAFGPDGYLYMAVGDGGGAGDQNNNGQNKNTLLGKILRLDVSGATYTAPATNPFFGQAGARDEIWAYGLRNPWRFSFDRATDDLYIGDVGQNTMEEIDFQPAASNGGENYGWRILEGSLCFNPSNCTPPADYVAPVAVYPHGANDSNGCSVTGGYVYRGSQFAALVGNYLYGDFCEGKIWGLFKNANNQWVSTLIKDTNYLISSFGEDEGGELYLTDYAAGSVIHITEAPLVTKMFRSQAAYDGFIHETSENSSTGGYIQASSNLIRIGDQLHNRQIRAIVSFNTALLPDNAVINWASLKFRRRNFAGSDPLAVLGRLQADIRSNHFGTGPQLESTDFQAPANHMAMAGLLKTLPNGFYELPLNKGLVDINKTGRTQLRLRFTLGDNNNNAHDFMNIFSGNYSVAADRPTLIIKYYLP